MNRSLLLVPLLVALSLGCRSGKNVVIGGNRTEMASAMKGWTEIKTSRIAISFPSKWKAVDMTAGDLDAMMDRVFGEKPEFAQTKASVKAAAGDGKFKLFVFSSEITPSHFRPNANVIMTRLGGSLDETVALTAAKFREKALPGTDVQPVDFRTDSGRAIKLVHHRMSAQSHPLTTIQYYQARGDDLVIVTFTTSEDESTKIEKIADQSMKSFRFD